MSNEDISVSMLIDNGIRRTIYQDSDSFTPLPLKNSINLDERRIHSWIKDENVKQCYKCSDTFSLLNRKHHCRNCGKIYCSKCSDYFIKIPEKIKTVQKGNPVPLQKTDHKLAKHPRIKKVPHTEYLSNKSNILRKPISTRLEYFFQEFIFSVAS